MAESGLSVMDSAIQAAQAAVGTLAGESSRKEHIEAPVAGPTTVDDATADFANRLALIAISSGMSLGISSGVSSGMASPGALFDAGRRALSSALKSYSNLDKNGVRQWLALP